MDMSQEMLNQQEHRVLVGLKPGAYAALLAVLLSVERYTDGGQVKAAAKLRALIEAEAGIEVHPDAIGVCIDEFLEDSTRG
ncbi:hypothetical protein MNJPNG_09515 [Cupriavidus oxalaticus]|uniref:hypothetical protein n=1 Tax=Cupriavidus oxalaticus TaxID=96344 RepID=UPI003F734C03